VAALRAAQTGNDHVSGSALAVQNSGTGSPTLWVFAINSGNQLIRRVRSGSSWQSPQVLDSDSFGIPSVGVSAINYAEVHVRGGDNILWRAGVDTNGVTGWQDLSTPSTIGQIAGSALTGGWFFNAGVVSFEVRSDANNLYTLREDHGNWLRQTVLQSDGQTKVNNENAVSALIGASALQDDYLAGRGLSASDDTTTWIAKGDVISKVAFKINRTFTGASGTPALSPVNGDTYVVVRFGSLLKYAKMPTGSFTTIPNCAVGGSPVIDPRGAGTGYVRGSSGQLVRWDINNNTCTFLGGIVRSAPQAVDGVPSSFDHSAIYKGSTDTLWFYNAASGTHSNLNIPL
jgi:hypothetical protein